MSKAKVISYRKERVSLTLSPDCVHYIKDLQKLQNSPSLSALVETMIENERRARRLLDLDASVTAYYNSLSPAERRADAEWGHIGADGLAAFDSELEEKPREMAHATIR